MITLGEFQVFNTASDPDLDSTSSLEGIRGDRFELLMSNQKASNPGELSVGWINFEFGIIRHDEFVQDGSAECERERTQ